LLPGINAVFTILRDPGHQVKPDVSGENESEQAKMTRVVGMSTRLQVCALARGTTVPAGAALILGGLLLLTRP